MILIAGLGNPGEKYENTRHNIGFMAIDKIAESFNFPKETLNSNALISKSEIFNKKVILVKPLTFMNLSGDSVLKIAQFYKINPENIIIIHDDIDIYLGKIKIAKNKGPGGHKGIRSIIQKIGNKEFIRIRIGICPSKKPTNTESFVLKKFKKEELEIVNDSLNKTTKAIKMIIEEGVDKSASLFNN